MTDTQYAGLNTLERAAAMAEPHMRECDAPSIEECQDCRGRLRVIRRVLEATEPVIRSEAETLKAGWRALRELDRHADTRAGIPAIDPSACAPCIKFTAAVMRGAKVSAALHLRCEESRRWHAEVAAAQRLAFGEEDR